MDTLVRSAEDEEAAGPSYETDFYAWALAQAALLRAGRLTEVDAENLAEEIDSLGKRERRELVSRLAIVQLHLLKWAYQPELRGRSWQASTHKQRRKIPKHLAQDPSLRASIEDTVAEAYDDATMRAETETGMPRDHFAWTCPFTFEQMMDEAFWPEQMP